MKNKKGIIQTGVVIAIVAILGLTVAGAGYVAYRNNMPSVKVGSDGVEVDANGVSVKTGSDGVSVDMEGTSVDVNGGVKVKVGGSTEGSVAKKEEMVVEEKVNNVLIFDASGSMSAQATGGTRIQLAKNAMVKFVDSLKNNVNLSVVAYGHKGNNTQAGKAVSCAGIEEIYYMGAVNANLVKSKVNALNPNGWTPITDSLKKAEVILNSTEGKKHAVIQWLMLAN
ncbi:MAG: D-amino-acid dehydrogenase [Candidatus Moranbacteria bacterium GW2011_GWF2_35_54]|nr:MAG: D-amino-acid dehydrogenase [Candidatus Moranbacteria bacterium GW2011_GWF2_35_54]